MTVQWRSTIVQGMTNTSTHHIPGDSTFHTADGNVGLDNCRAGIEISVGENDEMAYQTLTDAQALALAHALLAMVMERQAGA